MAGQRLTLSQATRAPTATSTNPMFHDADERLGSDSKVVMFKQGSEGMCGPCAALLSSPLNDRTGLFPGWEAGADPHAIRAQETLTE